ncbi:enterochelin esterase [Longilinea arvoryzae]|uniref:Enterochelin esterase n=1 Tax=Longilinea arvoryzae TaxID=360412 RepID=A0A0S7BFX2_9CHLR|nr:alpha/beta hydrolase-fold protein [Longilinea arvoryzae]GAP12362.1 enterochelin esterase [Longilinea arvoryzae]
MQNNTRLSLLLLILLLAGCASAAPTAASSPSATPLQPISTLQPSPTPQPSLTPTPAGCTETRGQVKSFAVFSTEIGKPMTVRVYTPPCYDPSADPGYPVLYLLHGQSFNDDQWQRLGVPETADRLIAAGEVRPFLVVMPQEYYYLADISQSAFGRAVVNELLPWVEENYAVCRETACRAIGGLSRGASWAVRLGYEYWPTFGAIGLHSLPSSSNGSIFYNWLPKIPEDQRPRLYLDIGVKDPYYAYALEFEGMLNDARLVHEWHLNPGTHNEEYWSAHVEEYLRWYAAGW